jgi:hypothetical protein
MGAHLANRRALLRERGRPMILRRQLAGTASASVSLIGFDRSFAPGELQGGVQQGDVTVETLAEEMAAIAWPAPPRNPDRLIMDNRTYTVLSARPIMEGADLIGWRIWARGA